MEHDQTGPRLRALLSTLGVAVSVAAAAALEAESGFDDAPVVIVGLVVGDAWFDVSPVQAAGTCCSR